MLTITMRGVFHPYASTIQVIIDVHRGGKLIATAVVVAAAVVPP